MGPIGAATARIAVIRFARWYPKAGATGGLVLLALRIAVLRIQINVCLVLVHAFMALVTVRVGFTAAWLVESKERIHRAHVLAFVSGTPPSACVRVLIGSQHVSSGNTSQEACNPAKLN